jgi:hypothetical protein
MSSLQKCKAPTPLYQARTVIDDRRRQCIQEVGDKQIVKLLEKEGTLSR